MMNRPRYYISDKNDVFKYWTSFREQEIPSDSFKISSILPIVTITEEALAEEDWTTEDPDSDYDAESNPYVTSILTRSFKLRVTIPTNNIGLGNSITISGMEDNLAVYNGQYDVIDINIDGGTNVVVETDIDPDWDAEYGGLSTVTPTTITSDAYVNTKYQVATRGLSISSAGDEGYYIDDAAPFIVYKEQIPANRIVLKMQTHVGTVGLGNITYNGKTVPDPLYDEEDTIFNRAVPISWKIQYLDTSNSWNTIKEFSSDDNSIMPVIPRDGYVELQYSNGSWEIGNQALEASTPLITDIVSPTVISGNMYEQFMLIKGLRVVVDTMSRNGVTFDLLEISPRLAVNMSDVTKQFSISKTASDLGGSGLPVGQLLASTGSITLADFEGEFNSDNPLILSGGTVNPNGSVISKYIKKGAQFKFYELVRDVLIGDVYYDSYVPLKTLYAEQMPDISFSDKTATLTLRDAYYYFEDIKSPRLLISDASLSYILATVLDSIGFTNYIYKRSPNDPDPIIRHFFVSPGSSVADVIQDLAVSTQTAVFFDEYNNLVFMSKSYMMPSIGSNDRATEFDAILVGDSDVVGDESTQPNIVEITKNENTIFNDGRIKFSERYIQKQVSSVSPAPKTSENGAAQQRLVLPNEQTWVYSSVLLWEPGPSDSVRPSGSNKGGTQSGEVLAAIPLKSNLSASAPTVVNGEVVNNVIDLGEAVYWLPRYNGYFHANSEIIKYDAVEYSVAGTGNVWIRSPKDYEDYFSELPYNGKIFPTGKVRIFSEPKYIKDSEGNTILKDGPVSRHGRAQFGTRAVLHKAGIDGSHWTKTNVTGIEMKSSLLFGDQYITEKKITGAKRTNGKKTITVPSYAKNYIIVGQSISGTGIPSSTTVSSWNPSTRALVMSKNATSSSSDATFTVSGKNIYDSSLINSAYGFCVTKNKTKAAKSSRTSVIKNYMSSATGSETSPESTLATSTLQSSALVFSGPEFSGSGIAPTDYLSCVYTAPSKASIKNAKHKHYGTRMRIIGTDSADPTLSTVAGAETVFTKSKLKGSSGGISVMFDKNRGTGYFLELMALTDENMAVFNADNANTNDLSESIFNIALYKTYKQTAYASGTSITGAVTSIKVHDKDKKYLKYYVPNVAAVGENASITGTGWNTTGDIIARTDSYVVLKYNGTKTVPNNGVVVTGDKKGTFSIRAKAIPIKLWTGMTNVITDNGMFTGQQRMTGQDNPSVYDLAIEYEEIGNSLKFYIYLNNILIGSVVDGDPIPKARRTNTVSLFVRGSSRVMFENLYALGADDSVNYRNSSYAPYTDSMNFNMETDSDAAFSKYSMPKVVSTTYFKGISPIAPPAIDMFYEEFGTIMREAKHYNVNFDKAYPAFRSMLAPTFNPIKGYAVSGYVATPYGAEFMVFNTMDSALVFGDNQNPLNILGITFTNQADRNYTMDDHLTKASDYSNYEMITESNVDDVPFDPALSKKVYQNIKNSRTTYGKKEFVIDATYIQTQDDAELVMDWMIKKTSTPRKSVGLTLFGMPHIQLGDIVKIHHKDAEGYFVNPDSIFVVYDIDYSSSNSGPQTTIYVSEVDTNG
jgi:hypothetical protein